MNSVKKTKAQSPKSKAIRKSSRVQKKVSNLKRKAPTKRIHKMQEQKVVKAPKVIESTCQFQVIIQSAQELAAKFKQAKMGSFEINGTKVKRNQTYSTEEVEQILQKRAIRIVEEIRFKFNQQKARICINCYQNTSQFFKRIFRTIIWANFMIAKKFGEGQINFLKAKTAYLHLIQSYIVRQEDLIKQFMNAQEEEHLKEDLRALPLMIEGPKKLVFPNSFENHALYPPELLQNQDWENYQFKRKGLQMDDYLEGLQVYLERQIERIQRTRDVLAEQIIDLEQENLDDDEQME